MVPLLEWLGYYYWSGIIITMVPEFQETRVRTSEYYELTKEKISHMSDETMGRKSKFLPNQTQNRKAYGFNSLRNHKKKKISGVLVVIQNESPNEACCRK
ncbi:hypothetical protein CEXT_211911 [Caerostris extrusa]|uniref:Uncharacterized protein n=1 Tax=Caerostris extrusa TaxID=172846 RepID=A0AAV4MUE1_CAEEX|nr:hypothetical protein CEXT_211911 [Caerostris extrusa]